MSMTADKHLVISLVSVCETDCLPRNSIPLNVSHSSSFTVISSSFIKYIVCSPIVQAFLAV